MKKRILCLLLALTMIVSCVAILASCGDDTTGGTVCTNHVDDDKNNACDICGAKMGTTACRTHKDSDKDNKCDKCGQDMGIDGDDVIEYPWDSQTLIFQMTENDNSKELSSGCHRYLAGDSTSDTSDIDNSIDQRNARAERETKTKVTYLYWANTNEYAWGQCITQIEQIVKSGSVQNVPDVYVNFIYDIVGASVKGYFANLKGTSRGIGALKGLNYFEFNDSDYNEEVDNRGYMNEWMGSVTLSQHKTYVVGSDYFTDMIRAFFIIPVGITLLESVGDEITGDWNDDGKFTIDDFYAQVEEGEWTYDLLMDYAEEVAVDDGVGTTSKWIGDNVVGFAMAHGGVAGTGLLYTTSVSIIEKQWDVAKNDYNYFYPDTNDGLADWCEATKTLFNATGVVLVAQSSDPNYKIDQWGSTHLQAIRKRFSEEAVLFGDIMMVGALEYEEYQEMRNPDGTGGFGVVPVPIYHSEGGDRYLTQIHNVGRPGAIAVNTTKFVECTAFLNYQSTHSTDILNQYYDFELMYNIAGGATGTVKMLQYIRQNVRTSFDKAMEDAIGVFEGQAAKDIKISVLVSNESFQCADIRTTYSTNLPEKRGYLDNLILWFQDAQD